jgi:hypothetical protein
MEFARLQLLELLHLSHMLYPVSEQQDSPVLQERMRSLDRSSVKFACLATNVMK